MVRKNKHVVRSGVAVASQRHRAGVEQRSELDRKLCRLIDMVCNACSR